MHCEQDNTSLKKNKMQFVKTLLNTSKTIPTNQDNQVNLLCLYISANCFCVFFGVFLAIKIFSIGLDEGTNLEVRLQILE